MAELRLVGLTKRYGGAVVVDALDLVVRDREFMTVLGPSGSGKTTVLRMIAGYVPPTAGQVRVGERAIQHLPPEKRDIGMVFQSYALFPHMTVFKNVAFGLERRRTARNEVERRVGEALALVRLDGLAQRLPRQLSGGQQQRVALARALVIRPTLLLLDEPLSNLDAKLRGEVRVEIRRLQRELGITTVLVTHDQEEALIVSDRVAVIRDGVLQQVDPPHDLYRRPANRFVADFVGRMNLVPATRRTQGSTVAEYALESGALVLGPPGPELALLGVRPEAIGLGPPPGDRQTNVLSGQLAYHVFLGELFELGVTLADGSSFTVRGRDLEDAPDRPGEPVRLWWPVERTAVLHP